MQAHVLHRSASRLRAACSLERGQSKALGDGFAIVVLVVAVALAASLELDLGARPNNQRREVGKSLLGYVGGGFLQSILDAHLQRKMT